MAPNFYEDAVFKRQLLDGLLGGGDDSDTNSRAAETTTGSGQGGLVGALTSGLGDVGSAVGGLSTALTPSSSSPSPNVNTSQTPEPSTDSETETTRATATRAGTSSTASSTSSTTSEATTTTSNTSTTSVSRTSTTSSSSTTPQPDSQSETTTYLSTSDGQTLTITNTIAAQTSETATQAASSQGFLQNKALSGTIFALAGVVGLVILIVASTWFIRRKKKNRLLADAERFDNLFPQHDPDANLGYANEKGFSDSGHSARSDESLNGRRRPLSDGTMRSVDQQSVNGGNNAAYAAAGPPGLGNGNNGARPAYAAPSQAAYAYDSPYGGIAYNQPTYAQSQVSLSRAPTQNTVMSGWGSQGGGAGQYQPPVPQVNARSDFTSQNPQGPGARAGGLKFTAV